ncbi:MAG TPA: nitrous oxide reductase family maturation protein NosD [Balneolaceae bacterium]|nr:nitrous oxide reductase family maturation protein NosD [Balneolaceae bacterium]
MKTIFIPITKYLAPLVLLLFCSVPVLAKNIIVKKNGAVQTLQAALDMAHKNDRIIVTKGIYAGKQITVNKSVTIIGRKGAVLDGMGKYQIMVITADSVTVKNLTFRNVGVSYLDDNAAIKLKNVSHCRITNDTLENVFFGVYLLNTNHSIVSDNTITGNGRQEVSSGGGIHLHECNHITITGNHVSKSRDGIYFEFVDSSSIRNNVSEHNIRYGLHLMYSHHDSFSHNTFIDNRAGGVVMYSSFITMKHNHFRHNWGDNNDGLLLKELNDGIVEQNRFYKNSSAVYSEGSNRVKFNHNNFIQNGWAAKIMSNCTKNDFTKNNFIENSFDVSTSGSTNLNSFNGNYWSSYSGYDLDRDGIGDVPFHPVSLFSYMVNKHKPALILMHSLFIKFLNVAEKALPVLTPKNLIDNNPLMRKVEISV